MKIRRDDNVKVISGKDRGKTGRVLRVDPVKQKVFIEGVNIQKRHRRPRSLVESQRVQDPIQNVEGPVHVSNVMLIDPKTNEPTRVKVERRDGRRVRVAKKSGADID